MKYTPNTPRESIAAGAPESPKYLEKLNISHIMGLLENDSSSPKSEYDRVLQTLSYMKRVSEDGWKIPEDTKDRLEQLATIIAYGRFEKASDAMRKQAKAIMDDVGGRFFLQETTGDTVVRVAAQPSGTTQVPEMKVQTLSSKGAVHQNAMGHQGTQPEIVSVAKVSTMSEGAPHMPSDAAQQTGEPMIEVVEHLHETYHGSLPHEKVPATNGDRQAVVRQYFENRQNETFKIGNKTLRIADVFAALNDGKIGNITLALEEKMQDEIKSAQ